MEEKDRETRREKRGWKNIGAIGEERGEQTIYIYIYTERYRDGAGEEGKRDREPRVEGEDGIDMYS